MSDLGHHGEWLSLLDVSGPFLAEPVLKEALPQGLQGLDPTVKREVRQAYDEWREALDFDEKDFPKLHSAWISFVLDRVLGYGEQFRVVGGAIADRYRYLVPENGITLVPDTVITDGRTDGKPLLLVKSYEAHTPLGEATAADGWAAGPAERMIELCRAAGVRLGLVTNGEQWTLIDAPMGAVTSAASWYARLWSQEPVTLQAFAELLGIRRFFSGAEAELTTLLDKSLTLQDEVTDALGEQVRRAVEVLVQSLDRADQDRNRELLKDVSPEELYEAGLTIMMRIVFLLSAEERGLLLLGDRHYEENYAVSTLRGQLRLEADEVQERRWDAWSRLLSLFRAVFAGVDHGSMRMPALGGSLFDPDRFPFLEGRSKGSSWKTEAAIPLPIDNRTVLLLLDAVQLFQGRTLSYLALDVEQIGYVYEGLLERTVVRAKEVTLDLTATKNAKAPWATLSELDDAVANGGGAVEELLKERTGSSASRIRNDLAKRPDEAESGKLLAACDGDVGLRDRIKPYFHMLRTDSWGYPLVYPKGTFMVASGSDRRETGTHYTPKSFTEAIVRTTLEPLVYVGPSDGAPRNEWRLKAPDELLDLKICDPAMGSGAFLVQVCRYLAERVVDGWAQAETAGKAVSADGEVLDEIGASEPLSQTVDERSLAARRLIAERCLYGADMNPLAVELAKLSIWLITLAKGRPFGFLDHNLRCGDSLLGVTRLDQIRYLDMDPNEKTPKKLFAATIDGAVSEASSLRAELRRRPIRDIRDIEIMAGLDEQARRQLRLPELVADALVAGVFGHGKAYDTTNLSIPVGNVLAGDEETVSRLQRDTDANLKVDLPAGKRRRQPFHWPLEFPEVFEEGGFDAFVGNPPFVGGQMLSGSFGDAYQSYLVEYLSYDEKSSVDLVVFFFLRVYTLLKPSGYMGLLARRTIAEGRNRQAGLVQLLNRGAIVYSSDTDIVWPGKASVVVHQINIVKGAWHRKRRLNGNEVDFISASLGDTELVTAFTLPENTGRMFQGSILLGEGFKLKESEAQKLLDQDEKNKLILFPFIGGNEINQSPRGTPSCWVINFFDWTEEKAETYSDAFEIVRRKVKPSRDGNKRKGRRDKWWVYGETASGLYRAIGHGGQFAAKEVVSSSRALDRVIVISTGVTKFPAFTFLGDRHVFSNKLCVLADDRAAIFAVLSSDVHAAWAWSQKTSLGADLYSLVYAHGNIFETFPFPGDVWNTGDRALEAVGQELFDKRQSEMEKRNCGLTDFYNLFNDPRNDEETFKEIRAVQSKLNKKVFELYGWSDLDPTCQFVEVGYLPDARNIRFTISEKVRSAVLRRLSDLNMQRAKSVKAKKIKNPTSAKAGASTGLLDFSGDRPPGKSRTRR
jgi:hypothetical protein